MDIQKNISLKAWNHFKVGGFAEYFYQPETPQQLQKALQWARINKHKVTVLGSGTNVLISDKGVQGLLISTQKLQDCFVQKTKTHIQITCFAGVLKSHVMKIFKKHSLAPCVFLSGLPGDVAGGVIMNAGVSRSFEPSEFSKIVHSIDVMTDQGSKTYQHKDIQWSYRKTTGINLGVIYKIQCQWPLITCPNLNEKIKEEIKKRRTTQPLSMPSCGSIFKNPYPLFAGKLIEQAGLKKLTIGQAQISNLHGNFIINLGKAKATDIDNLIQEVQKKVYDKFQVLLKTEIHYIGIWDNKNN